MQAARIILLTVVWLPVTISTMHIPKRFPNTLFNSIGFPKYCRQILTGTCINIGARENLPEGFKVSADLLYIHCKY
jgi:hypothetical protein